MESTLFRLIFLVCRGKARQLYRMLKSPRGAIGVLVFLFFTFCGWVPIAFLGVGEEGAFGKVFTDFTGTSNFPMNPAVSVAMLVICLLALVGRTERNVVYFSPSEIDMLFPAPFYRRHLLAYRITLMMIPVLPSLLLFVIPAALLGFNFGTLFIGSLLFSFFLTLYSTGIGLALNTISERAYGRARIALFAFLLVGIMVLALSTQTMWQTMDLRTIATTFFDSKALRVLLLPFAPFVNIFFSERLFPDALPWIAAAGAIDLSLFMAIVYLDADYREVAIVTNQRVQERLKRMQGSGGAVWSKPKQHKDGLVVSMLPWCSGVGPILWRQLVRANRQFRWVFRTMLLLLFAFAAVAYFATASGNTKVIYTILAAVVAMGSINGAQMLPLDFRGDLDRMEALKSLPLRSSAIALAQLITPAFILSLFEIALACVMTIFAGEVYYVVIALFMLPLYNFILVAVDNIAFLIMPVRINAKSPGDFRTMSQIYLSMIIKMLLLGAALGVGGALGGLTGWLSGSWLFGGVIAWLCLLAEAIAMVPCVAWAFDRFDVTKARATA
jgi:hypothetical protein